MKNENRHNVEPTVPSQKYTFLAPSEKLRIPDKNSVVSIDHFFHMGNSYFQKENFSKAVDCFQHIIELDHSSVEAHLNMGLSYLMLGTASEAVVCFNSVIQYCPDHSEGHHCLGRAYQLLGQTQNALQSYRQALILKPGREDTLFQLAEVYQQSSQIEEAMDCYRLILSKNPNHTDSLNNMGNCFHKQGRFEDASSCYRKIIQISPDRYSAYNNMAKLHQDRGFIEDAIGYYNKALNIRPDYVEARFNRSMAYLLQGNFLDGWNEYEWRFHRSEWRNIYPHRHQKPIWDGISFSKKRLLIHAEQGFGDTIQFARYLPMVKAMGGEIIFETLPPLNPLFRNFPGVDKLIDLQPHGISEEPFDMVMPIMSLPRIFRTTLKSIPEQIPYIKSDRKRTHLWRHRIQGRGLKIGIVWSGKASHGNDHNRSVALDYFKPLIRIPGTHFFGLQSGNGNGQASIFSNPAIVDNLGQSFSDFGDTAAVVENLDLVISVDTAVAHLAGAMGKPVWLLLPHPPDWRWLLNRDDSPWYPTMKLFRQKTHGDWPGVFIRLEEELNRIVLSRN